MPQRGLSHGKSYPEPRNSARDASLSCGSGLRADRDNRLDQQRNHVSIAEGVKDSASKQSYLLGVGAQVTREDPANVAGIQRDIVRPAPESTMRVDGLDPFG